MLWKIIISSACLVLTYPKANLWVLAWVAFLPLFYALEGRKNIQKFFIGYIFGIFLFSGVLYWLVNVSVLGTVILVLLLSFFPAIFCLLYPTQAIFSPLSLIVVPAAWVFTEFMRAHFLTGFPWALLGYSQSTNIEIIQISDITGAYGVSFLVVLVNFVLYTALKKSPKRLYSLIFTLFLMIFIFSYGSNRISRIYPDQRIKVAVIQGNIPQENKWDPAYRDEILNKYSRMTQEALLAKPDLVIWPETSVPGYLEEENDLKKKIASLATEGNVYILAGSIREEEGKIFNSAILMSPEGNIAQTYDKVHLVLFGEYLPLEGGLAWIQRFIDKPIGDFDKGENFTLFDIKTAKAILKEKSIIHATSFYKFGVLICFEDIFPYTARTLVKNGARFLVNITNDAWFGKTSAPYQHAQGSVFRAVENRVAVVRAANTGLSCFIDHRGVITESVSDYTGEEIFIDGFITKEIRPVFAKTFYTKFGDVFAVICSVLALIGFLVYSFKRRGR